MDKLFDAGFMVESQKYKRFLQSVDWLCKQTATIPEARLMALVQDSTLTALQWECERALGDTDSDETYMTEACREWLHAWKEALQRAAQAQRVLG